MRDRRILALALALGVPVVVIDHEGEPLDDDIYCVRPPPMPPIEIHSHDLRDYGAKAVRFDRSQLHTHPMSPRQGRHRR